MVRYKPDLIQILFSSHDHDLSLAFGPIVTDNSLSTLSVIVLVSTFPGKLLSM